MPREREPSVEALQEEVARLQAQSEALQTRLYALQSAHRVLQGEDEEYSALRHRIREAAREWIPADETVLVMSKGDAELVDLYGREAWHFPRQWDGRYAGFYPKRGISAIAHLEAMRGRGASYLLIPETSRWWLDHYPAFASHLERYRRVLDDPESCVIIAIREQTQPADDPAARLGQALEEYLPFLGEDPPILDWATGLSLKAAFPQRTVFSPPTDDSALPYLDGSVDVVVVLSEDKAALQEAKRVAGKLVVNLAELGRPNDERWLGWKTSPRELTVPSVSVVIPCHNGLAYTTSCLATLRETLPKWFRGEIIVVDDASSDETAAFLARLRQKDDRVSIVRNRSNRGFLAACNAGAKTAHCDYLLFLNNDTVLLPGWLAPLLSMFEDHPDAGVVGGKLLFEDGTLQEAGALVFSDASAAKIGYFDPDVEAPFYQHVREVDYVSAAFLITPRAVFQEVGGFDPRYGFGYYDDDDYCFAVRAAGRRVYYQPESVIVHVEGASAGTDLSDGLKQYQIANQKLFADKWKKELAQKPDRLDPSPLDWQTTFALAGRTQGA
jgi:GT2 family glycosyltransferase